MGDDVYKLTRKMYKDVHSLLEQIDWPKQLRQAVKGHGYTLGVTNTVNGPRINKLTDLQTRLTKTINDAIRRTMGSNAPPWASLQINKNTVSTVHTDSNNHGESIVMLAGDFKGGEFHMQDDSIKVGSSQIGSLHTFNGNQPHLSQPFEGTRYSIIAFYHTGTRQLDPEQWQQLSDLGFQLHWECYYNDSFVYNYYAGDRIPTPIPIEGKTYNRRLVELFCGHNSVLGRITSHSKGCDVFRVTEQLDMDRPETHRAVIEAGSANNVCFWISAPCKGGSKWNQFNWVAHPELRPHISGLVQQFAVFLTNVIKILRAVRARGFRPIICIELPSSCAYWYMLLMLQFLDEFGLQTTVFHGCAYGLKAQFEPNIGRPIKKSWTVATSHPVLKSALHRTCICKLPHAQCAGRETSGTENYTEEFAAHFHTLLDYIASNDLWQQGHDGVHCSGPSSAPCLVAAAPCSSSPPTIMSTTPGSSSAGAPSSGEPAGKGKTVRFAEGSGASRPASLPAGSEASRLASAPGPSAPLPRGPPPDFLGAAGPPDATTFGACEQLLIEAQAAVNSTQSAFDQSNESYAQAYRLNLALGKDLAGAEKEALSNQIREAEADRQEKLTALDEARERLRERIQQGHELRQQIARSRTLPSPSSTSTPLPTSPAGMLGTAPAGFVASGSEAQRPAFPATAEQSGASRTASAMPEPSQSGASRPASGEAQQSEASRFASASYTATDPYSVYDPWAVGQQQQPPQQPTTTMGGAPAWDAWTAAPQPPPPHPATEPAVGYRGAPPPPPPAGPPPADTVVPPPKPPPRKAAPPAKAAPPPRPPQQPLTVQQQLDQAQRQQQEEQARAQAVYNRAQQTVAEGREMMTKMAVAASYAMAAGQGAESAGLSPFFTPGTSEVTKLGCRQRRRTLPRDEGLSTNCMAPLLLPGCGTCLDKLSPSDHELRQRIRASVILGD